MQAAAIALLLLICGALALRIHAVEKNLCRAAEQLRARTRTCSSVRLLIEAPDPAAEDLLTAVNDLLELRERETADHRRQEKSIRQQISNVSHDLRTPLTSILGYLQLLEGDALSPAERAEYLAVVRGRAKHLQSLITSFYDLSRLEGDEYPLVKEPVDLASLLRRLAAEFYNDFTDRSFDVTVELDEGLPPVLTDPAGALRIFANLLKNALEHGEQSLTLRLYREGSTLISAVSNGAPSLTEEDLPHVFERFYQGDKTRGGQGTGLGLAIVNALARRMGHSVDAALADGVFTVCIGWKL